MTIRYSKVNFGLGDNCYVCGKKPVQVHHIYGGYNRKLSTEYGCVVSLCQQCHYDVHNNPDRKLMSKLRELCQRWCMKKYEWTKEQFIKIFGRNYIDGE